MQKLQRILASLSVVAVLSTLVVSTSVSAFTDVPEGEWYAPFVSELVEAGVVTEGETFRPGDDLNRAEAVKFLVEAFGLEGTTELDFSDVAEDDWYYAYVQTAVANGLVEGYEDGTFKGENGINRAEWAKVVTIAAGLPTCELESPFSDIPAGEWFEEFAVTAYCWMVMDGYDDGTFGGANSATRAEAAKMISSAMSPVERGADVVEDEEDVDDEDEDVDIVVGTGDLYVEISADTPEGDNIPASATVAVAAWDFTASDSDVKLTNLVVTHESVGDKDEITGLVLKDENGVRVSKAKTSINSDQEVTFSLLSGGLVIADGETTTIVLHVTTQTVAAGPPSGIHAFSIVDEDDVSASSEAVDGDFPAEGEEFAISGVDAGSLVMTNDGTTADVKAGETGVPVAKFRLAASNEDVELTSLTLKETGSAAVADAVSNLVLTHSGETLAEGVLNDNYVTFMLDEPMFIEDGDTEKFKIEADIVGEAGRILNFALDNSLDIEGTGLTYNYGVGVTSSGFTGEDVNIDAGAITLTKVEPNTSVRRNKDNVVFGTVKVSVNAGADLELEAFNATITTATGDVEALLENIELYDATNGSVYDLTVADGDTTSADVYDRDLGISLEDGEDYEFQLRADTLDVVGVVTDTFTVSLTGIGDGTGSGATMTTGMEFKETGDDTYVSDVTPSALTFKTVDGESATVSGTAITLTNKQIVVGTEDVLVLQFEMEETAGVSDVLVTEIKVEDDGDELDSAHVASLDLYTVEGTEETLIDSVSGSQAVTDIITFDNLSVTVPKEDKVTFRVKMNSVDDDGNDADTHNLMVNGYTMEDDEGDNVYITGDADGVLAGGDRLDSGRVVTLNSTGILYVAADNTNSEVEDSSFQLAGTTSDIVAAYILRADKEDIKVKDLTITAAGTTAFEAIANEMILLDSDKVTEIARKSVTPGEEVVFSNVDYIVEETESTLYVKLELNPYGKDELGVLNEADITMDLSILDVANAISAEGVSSNDDLTVGDYDSTADAGEVVYNKNPSVNTTYDEAGETSTGESTAFGIQATMITSVSMVSTDGDDDSPTTVAASLTNGWSNIAILKVVTAASANSEADGTTIKTYLNDIALNFIGDNGTAASPLFAADDAITLQKIGSSTTSTGTEATWAFAGNTPDIDEQVTFDVDTDLGTDAELMPGTTTYFLVKANVANLDGATAGLGYLQVELDDLDAAAAANFEYIDSSATVVPVTTVWNKLWLGYTTADGVKIDEQT